MIAQVVQIATGGDDNFSYLVANAEAVALIDPAYGEAMIEQELKRAPGPLACIINTHSHGDHTALNEVFQERYGVPVIIHEEGAARVRDPKRAVKDGDTAALGKDEMRFIHTPGHTRDSMVVLCGDALFTGDTLFADEDCGKLGSRDMLAEMFDGLQKIKAMPDELIVYSGHRYGKKDWTTLKYEKEHNPALRCETLEEFRKFKGY